MVRVDAEAAGEGLVAMAYEGTGGQRMVVLKYRRTAPLQVSLERPGAKVQWEELVSPYDENSVTEAGPGEVRLAPGEMMTLSNVGLGN